MVLTYIFTFGLILVAIRIMIEQWKARLLTRKSWDDVIARLQPTATGEITMIALEYMNPGQSTVTTDAPARFANLGGLKGVKQMRMNADLLIALAAQAERWHPEATRSLVTQMRRDGAELRRAAFLLSLHVVNVQSHWGRVRIQRAAAAYYRMIYRLFEAAREFSPESLASLSKAVWT